MGKGNSVSLRIWFFRCFTVVGLPLLLLLGFEAGLHLLKVGYPTSFTVDCDRLGEESTCENNRFTWQFFPQQIARTASHFAIPKVKSAQTYRIFVLGASAAMGDPEPSYGFSRILEIMLRERYPDIKFEVVNTAITAINSHVVLPIAEDAAQLDPDLFIIYLGNNEVVGPYGAGTVFSPISPNWGLIRAGIKFKATRTGQLLGQLLKGESSISAPTVWRGMEMFLDQQVRFDDPGLESVYNHFEKNLYGTIDQAAAVGADVILSTVGTNLRDSAPFASLHRKDLSSGQLEEWQRLYDEAIALAKRGEHLQAIKRYQGAAAIDDTFADLHYRHGKSLLETGESTKAAESFTLARDYDVLRFRADSRINEIIRNVGKSRSGLHLVDTDHLFADASPHGIAGGDLFYEHVHMTLQGNYLIAEKLLEQVDELLYEKFQQQPKDASTIGLAEAKSRLAFSDFDRYRIEKEVLKRMGKPPFNNQLDHQTQLNFQQGVVESIEQSLTQQARSEAVTIYEKAIKQLSADPWLYYNYGMLLEKTDEPSRLAELFNKVLELLPGHAGAQEKLAAALIRLGRYEEAKKLCQSSIELMPYNNRSAYYTLASAQANLGMLDESIATYERLLLIDPSDSIATYNQLGRIYIHRKEFSTAAEKYRKAVEFNSAHYRKRIPDIYYHLGYTLKRANRLDEASIAFKQAISEYRMQLDESLPSATLYRAIGTALVEYGDIAAATEAFVNAVSLEPDQLVNHMNLLRAYEAQGLLNKAAEAAQKSIQVFGRMGMVDESEAIRKYLNTLQR